MAGQADYNLNAERTLPMVLARTTDTAFEKFFNRLMTYAEPAFVPVRMSADQGAGEV